VNTHLRRSGSLYGTRSQEISQFYLHTPRLSTTSANGMNHTYLRLPSRNWYSFPGPGGMEGYQAADNEATFQNSLFFKIHILFFATYWY